MFSYLGFPYLTVDLAIIISLVIAVGATLGGWVADAILDDFAFGMFGNTWLLFIGAVGGLIGWNRFVDGLKYIDPSITIAVGVGGAFGFLLLLVFTKRFVSS